MAAHVLTAQAAVRMLAAEGAAPYCPHTNVGHGYGRISEQHASDINEAFLLISSAIYLLPGWQQSAGTQIEVTMAQKCGIPRLHDPQEVRLWLKHRL